MRVLCAWQEAGLSFDVFSLTFNDGLNEHDVSHARQYCNTLRVKLNEIHIDIVNFLIRENYDVGIKYRSPSPHFNTHYKLFDLLKAQGYTGVCCGVVS